MCKESHSSKSAPAIAAILLKSTNRYGCGLHSRQMTSMALRLPHDHAKRYMLHAWRLNPHGITVHGPPERLTKLWPALQKQNGRSYMNAIPLG